MASKAKKYSEGPELKARISGGKRFAPNTPEGRTKAAYAYQPSGLKWKCTDCIAKVRTEKLKEEKGRDHATADEVAMASYKSKEALEAHQARAHGA